MSGKGVTSSSFPIKHAGLTFLRLKIHAFLEKITSACLIKVDNYLTLVKAIDENTVKHGSED